MQFQKTSGAEMQFQKTSGTKLQFLKLLLTWQMTWHCCWRVTCCVDDVGDDAFDDVVDDVACSADAALMWRWHRCWLSVFNLQTARAGAWTAAETSDGAWGRVQRPIWLRQSALWSWKRPLSPGMIKLLNGAVWKNQFLLAVLCFLDFSNCTPPNLHNLALIPLVVILWSQMNNKCKYWRENWIIFRVCINYNRKLWNTKTLTTPHTALSGAFSLSGELPLLTLWWMGYNNTWGVLFIGNVKQCEQDMVASYGGRQVGGCWSKMGGVGGWSLVSNGGWLVGGWKFFHYAFW